MATNNGAVAARPYAASTRASRKPGSRRRKRATTRRDSRVRSRHSAQAALDDLRDNASEYVEQGLEKVGGLERKLKRFVTEQPWKAALICSSLALAAGAGLLIGRHWLRRDPQPPVTQFPWQ